MKRIVLLFALAGIISAYAFSQPLSGNYTIGGSSPDYTTFTTAVTALINNGVNGPVFFDVAPGTYNEQISIPAITGTSALNTITFQSSTGDSTDVILTWAATGSADNYTLQLDGAEHIIFRSITLQATGTGYARVVHLANAASYDIFLHNRFIGQSDLSELVFADIANFGDPASTDITFLNNRFENGKRSISLSGGYDDPLTHTVIEQNDFENASEHAVHIDYSSHSLISRNRITSHWHITGIHIEGLSESDTLNANVIRLYTGGLGIHLYATKQITDTTILSNNFIYLNTTIADHAIDIYSAKMPVKVLHNTVHITGLNQYSYCLYFNGNSTNAYKRVMNNVLANDAGGMALYYYYLPGVSDYNDLYSNGAYVMNYYNTNGITLQDWQNNFHHDLHTVTVNPYFVQDDSWQVQNQALDGNASPVAGITTDIEGKNRDASHPDIGAWEFTPAPVPLSGTYTVGGGTADFDSLKDAVKAFDINGVGGPVIFNINPGTYPEQLVIYEVKGASESNTITFRSSTGDSTDVIITCTPVYDNKPYTILLDGGDHIVFKNLTITTQTPTGLPLMMKNGACFNEVSHAEISAPDGNNNPLVQLGDDDKFIYSYIDSNNVFRNSHFLGGKYAVNAGVAGVSNSIVVASNTLVEDNVIEENTIYLYNDLSPVIRANKIHIEAVERNYTTGIYIRQGTVENNFVYMHNPGSYVYTGIMATGPATIVYNTVKTDVAGLPLKTYAAQTRILNNILTTQGSIALEMADTTGNEIDHNIYFSTLPPRLISYNPGGTWYYRLESWQKTSGFDAHSIFHETQFVSPTDLHTSDPWANARGIPVTGVTTDIDGDARDATHPDIGADEFDGVSPLKGEYTIGAGGDFLSFSEVADTLLYLGVEDSVHFRVLEGTYEEQFTLDGPQITRLPDTAAIVFVAENSDSGKVTLQYPVTTWDKCIVTLNKISHVTLQGFTFRSLSNDHTFLVNIYGQSTDNRFLDNTFIGTDNKDPMLYSLIDNDHRTVITGNRFYGGGYGVYMAGDAQSDAEQGLVIRNNSFREQTVTGMYIVNQSAPVVEANSIIHTDTLQVTWAGIFLTSGQGGLVANNTISFPADTKTAGIALNHWSGALICYNSVRIDGTTHDSRCYNQENVSNSNTMKNNILSNTSGGLVIYSADAASFTSDHNGFHLTGDRFAWTDHGMATLADWVSETGQDNHSYDTDPAFFSADSLYTVNPLLNGTAEPLTEVITDLTGQPRDATHPDMGAYEFEGIYVLGEDTTLCNNTSVTLDAGAGYDSYLWNTGATTQTLETTPQPGGETWYRVTVSVGGTSYKDSVKVTSTGPTVDLGADTAICEGTSLTLDAGSGDYSYLWSDNSTGQTLDVTAAGTYHVTVTDTRGCTNKDTVAVTVNTPVTVTLSYDTDNNQLAADYQNGTLYTWYLDGNDLTSGSDAAITPSASGDYHVEVIDENGCTAVSDTLYVSLTGIHDAESHGVSIYPNPSSGKITLQFDEIMEDLHISVFDLTGTKVYETTKEQQGSTQKVLNLEALPDGIYLLQIRSQAPQKILRIVIHH